MTLELILIQSAQILLKSSCKLTPLQQLPSTIKRLRFSCACLSPLDCLAHSLSAAEQAGVNAYLAF